ncbi:two-component system C4-dicarboxylate transport sensor histidine kinase DctB [Hydrogenophaga palleronii]|uniref:histidine kinase n=1 Tax=Hydrogenophaga palleronii TaxID=65655 RepID=A0ABU1WKK6_9BURK|nr:ATP-binding protein [Hydrogenophaga palleronii]MDR7149824.1 two-component system C4-dicarboxylate transport sensor histidine kinase DctB [Hydrogenophaga palleronii]
MTKTSPDGLRTKAAPGARRRRFLMGWGTALALVAAAAYMGHEAALQTGLSRLRDAAQHRLDLVATGLDAHLARFEYLPALLEMTPVVPALLDAPSDPGLRDGVNRYLKEVAASVGAEMLYVLEAGGTSVAASDWDQPGTSYGQDYSFRPYMRDAVKQGRGRFYGVGITSGKPGYYLSYALRRDDQLRGVMTVKVNIDEAERAWRNLPGHVLLIDERGVVILSTLHDLKYRPLAPLDAEQHAEVRLARSYGQATLQPADWSERTTLADGVKLVTLSGRDHLASTRALQHSPWQLVVLDEMAPVRVAARYAAITGSLAMAVLVLVAVTLWQRRRAVRHKLASQAALQAAHDSLESTVVARTAQLRSAQGELVHAGKLAAMGQMSAGIVHELNQPLTALRTLSDSAAILLEKGRSDDVRGNLRRITGMVDRLARLTTQLKTFAHKSDTALAHVTVARSIADAQALLESELQERGIRLLVDVQPIGLSLVTDEAALSGVLVNLMRNAVDAMREAAQRELRVQARAQGGRLILSVADTGHGIRPDILERLFEPFVTSKPAGAGLGLGLVISEQLVRGAGGVLRAANRDEGGAIFTIDLPLGVEQPIADRVHPQ